LYTDDDNDGYTENQGDCDDANAQVNPGATEIEDGIDNDCDGEIDEGFNQSGTVTDIDGNTYDYINYGDQVWTVENAEMVTYRDGTPIPQVTDNTEWESLTTGAWCYFDNDPTKPRLYNWYAVMGIHDAASLTDASLRKEFAPEGWHVPSDAEWTTLENYLIANGYNYDGTTTGNKIAKAISSQTNWSSSNVDGSPGFNSVSNNASSFNSYPVGSRNYSDGMFEFEGFRTCFWTTSVQFSVAYSRNIVAEQTSFNHSGHEISHGFSVRFVRD
jgi:uncharacterized protein (TIGR02145 family)